MEAYISAQATKTIGGKPNHEQMPSTKSSESKHQDMKIPCDRQPNNHTQRKKTIFAKLLFYNQNA